MEDRTRPSRENNDPIWPRNSNEVTVLYAGRFEGRKGTDALLAAIPELCEKFKFARFVLVGEDRTLPDGSTLGGAFRARHSGASFLDRVVFAGEVSDAQLEQHLQNCDIFVAPSRYESFGLVFLEAMMFAKPVVGCRAGGMNEVIEDGVTGLLAEPGDVSSLVSAFSALLNDPVKRAEFGETGRERYLQHYTRDALIERTLKFYRETLSRRAGRSNAANHARSVNSGPQKFVPVFCA
jgi:hypothetical protein